MEIDVDEVIEAIRSGRASPQEGALLLGQLARSLRARSGTRERAAAGDDAQQVLRDSLVRAMAATLQLDPAQIEPDVSLSEYGFDSLTLVEFAQALTREYPFMRLEPTVFLGHPTLDALARHLVTRYAAELRLPEAVPAATHAGSEAPPRPDATRGTGTARVERDAEEDVAVVGLAGRFPACDSVLDLWRLLARDGSALSEVPPERWRWQDCYGDPRQPGNRTDCRHGAFLRDVDRFDAPHFGIAAEEARLMDPQQRLLLEVAWETIEHAGYSRRALLGRPVGLFFGVEKRDYLELMAARGGELSGFMNTGNTHSMLVNRVSHFFDWHGPSLALDAACASSMAAIAEAVDSLRRGRVELALAGGANLLLTPWLFIVNRRLGMLTHEDVMRPFDRRANGHLNGEAVALVALKRLSAALGDGDTVYAVLKGVAVRHGGRSLFLTAPNPASHREVIEDALRRAGLGPADVDYVEAQGTADPVVDRAELGAYQAVFGGRPGAPVRIGTLKGNTGHLGAASGVAALIKGILSLRNGRLTSIRGLRDLNWSENDGAFGCEPLREACEWREKRVAARRVPRRLGVHNFGYGGVTGHVVVEEFLAPQAVPRAADGVWVVPLSARTRPQLVAAAQRLERCFANREHELLGLAAPSLPSVAATLQLRRDAWEARAAFVVRDVEDLRARLAAFVERGGVAHAAADATPPGDDAAADLHRLAQEWMEGGNPDWSRLYGEQVPEAVPLPAYPFAKLRYWFTDAAPAAARPDAAGGTRVALAQPQAEARVEPPDAERSLPADADPLSEPLVVADLRRLGAQVLGLDEGALKHDDANLMELGFDSLRLREFAEQLGAHFGIDVNPALFFSHTTVNGIARHLLATRAAALARRRQPRVGGVAPPASGAAPAGDGRVGVEATPEPSTGAPSRMASAGPPPFEPIAIIGVSGRFPGADDVDELWGLLSNGRDVTREIPAERFDWRELYLGPDDARNRIATNRAGFITGIEDFDPLFFDLSPREAEQMDPRQRLLLQEAWRAFEDAGYPARALRGTPVGVFVGVEEGDFGGVVGPEGLLTGNHAGVLAARISYFLDLHGPSLAINTACSSGLVALHQACRALQAGECDMALAGGVNLLLGPDLFRQLSRMGMLSPSGRCAAFDSRADGILPGEAVAAVLLKPLSRALAEGDRVHGVIRGSGVNNDGRTNGLTAPNGAAQARLIRSVYAKAGLTPAGVSYVVAHGTGTRLGDPVEVQALREAFAGFTDREGFCALGSVKPNLGHTFAASGLVSLITVLLGFRHGQIPASVHCQRENEYLALEQGPFQVNKTTRSWERLDGRPRLAAVSAFGISGTNAHVVLEEPPEPARDEASAAPAGQAGRFLVPLSARSEERLVAVATRLGDYLRREGLGRSGCGLELADVAFTLQTGREPFERRVAFVVADAGELLDRLARFVAGEESLPGCFRRSAAGDALARLFSSDDDAQEILARWARKGRLDKLAELWVQGAAFDWGLLHEGNRPRRVPLPTYPFARRRCWPQRVTGAVAPAPAPVTAVAPAAGSPAAPARSPARRRVALTPLGAHAKPGVDAGAAPSATAADGAGALSAPAPVAARARAAVDAEVEVPRPAVVPAGAAVPDVETVRVALRRQLCEVLFLDESEVSLTRKFVDLGLDSILAVEWVRSINRHYAIDLAAARLYDHPTLAELALCVQRELALSPGPALSAVPPRAPDEAASPRPSVSTAAGEAAEVDTVRLELRRQLAEVLYLEPGEIGEDRKFVDLGVDSVLGVEWIHKINARFGLDLAATKLYDHATLRELARFVAEHGRAAAGAAPAAESQAPAAARDAGAAAESACDDDGLAEIVRRLASGGLSIDEAEHLLDQASGAGEPAASGGLDGARRRASVRAGV